MSRLVEYEIGQVYPCIHDSRVDTKRVELEWVEEESYPEYRACDGVSSMLSDREEEGVHEYIV